VFILYTDVKKDRSEAAGSKPAEKQIAYSAAVRNISRSDESLHTSKSQIAHTNESSHT